MIAFSFVPKPEIGNEHKIARPFGVSAAVVGHDLSCLWFWKVGRISDSVMRRMVEGQHAVQYGYRLLHPTVCALRVKRQGDFVMIAFRSSPSQIGDEHKIARPFGVGAAVVGHDLSCLWF